MKKYLFIDIDGVLNTENHIKSLQNKGVDSNDQYGPLFAPQAVQNLKAIVELTDAKIVISSSWKEYGVEFLQEMWSERNMPVEFYSVTPSLILTSYLDHIEGNSFRLPERHMECF